MLSLLVTLSLSPASLSYYFPLTENISLIDSWCFIYMVIYLLDNYLSPPTRTQDPWEQGHGIFLFLVFCFFLLNTTCSRLLYSSLTPNRLNYLPSPAYSQSGRELTSRGSHFVSWALQCQMDDITTTCWVAEQKGNLFLKGQKFKLLFSF